MKSVDIVIIGTYFIYTVMIIHLVDYVYLFLTLHKVMCFFQTFVIFAHFFHISLLKLILLYMLFLLVKGVRWSFLTLVDSCCNGIHTSSPSFYIIVIFLLTTFFFNLKRLCFEHKVRSKLMKYFFISLTIILTIYT